MTVVNNVREEYVRPTHTHTYNQSINKIHTACTVVLNNVIIQQGIQRCRNKNIEENEQNVMDGSVG